MTPYVFAGLQPVTQQKALKTLKLTEYKITHQVLPSKIISVVCDYFNVTELDLIGKSRERIFVNPRQIAISLIYLFSPDSTLKKIGKHFNRHHSTVIYSNETVSDLCDTDRNFKRNYNNILKLL